MFCNHCGKEQKDHAQFCHSCGKPLREIDNGQRPMSIHQYMSHTNIQSVEEAQRYLRNLRILFVLVGLLSILIRGSQNEAAVLLLFIHIPLLIYFVYYCVKVIKAEKISRADAIFSIIFAPISWIWFYPAITEPLKIIIGKKKPPVSLPPTPTEEERKITREKADKKFWKTIKYVSLISFLLIAIGTVAAIYYSNPEEKTTTQNNQNQLAKQSNDFKFTSIGQEFSIIFPEQPTRSEEDIPMEEFGQAKYITYQASAGKNLYYVFVYEYSDPRISDSSSEFDPKTALEGALNGIANALESSKLISTQNTTLEGKPALVYKLQIDAETNLSGIMVFSGSRMYNIAIEYSKPILDVEKELTNFKDSFKLNI